MSWQGHGLEVERTVALDDGAVRVSMRISSPQGASLVSLEHVSAGLELLEPELELVLPAGFGYELSEQDGPLRRPRTRRDTPSCCCWTAPPSAPTAGRSPIAAAACSWWQRCPRAGP